MYVCPYLDCSSHSDACLDMIIDNDPPITRNISVPRDMSQLSCSSFSAGIVEAVLDGLGFVSISTFRANDVTDNFTNIARKSDGP